MADIMAFYERPNLKRKMEVARAKEDALKRKGATLTNEQKKDLQKAVTERRAAETIYYSASGQGHAPWQLQLQRWGLALFAVIMILFLIVSLS